LAYRCEVPGKWFEVGHVLSKECAALTNQHLEELAVSHGKEFRSLLNRICVVATLP